MNENQAKQAFEQGRLLPRCPNCNGGILLRGKRVKMTEKGTYNTTLVCGYQCIQCQERFIAYIGAPTDAEG